jgi:hypothetical protein
MQRAAQASTQGNDAMLDGQMWIGLLGNEPPGSSQFRDGPRQLQ